MSEVKYKPGDRVVALRWPRDGAGVIVKFAPVNPLVRWDGSNEDKRTRIDDIRPETAEDVARRDHEQAMRAWRERRPNVTNVIVFENVMGHRDHIALAATAPHEMREAAAELLKLADWFAERPVEP